MNKIKAFLKPYYHKLKNKLKFYRRIGLKNKKVSIISNNCGGGFITQYFGLKYNSPTEGLFFVTEDYIKFVKNLKYYLTSELEFISPKESKNYETVKGSNRYGEYPVAKCKDIEIYFMHYKTKEEAENKWIRRSERVDYTNLYCILFENDFTTSDMVKDFDKIALPHIELVFNEYKDLKYAVKNDRVKYMSGHPWLPEEVVSTVDWKKEFNKMINK